MVANVESRWKRLLDDATAATLILLLPFLVFLRFNGYGIKHPEVFVCCGLIAVAGLGWGLLMGLGQVARVLVTTFLLVLLVDVQTEWLTTVGLRLLLNVALLGAATWFLRRHLAKIVMVVFGAMAPA